MKKSNTETLTIQAKQKETAKQQEINLKKTNPKGKENKEAKENILNKTPINPSTAGTSKQGGPIELITPEVSSDSKSSVA